MTAPGSFTSFDEFYRSQNVRLFHFFRRKVGREAAPDLVQEAFTKMLHCGAFERVENPPSISDEDGPKFAHRKTPDLAQERVRSISFGRNAGCCNPAGPRMEDSVDGVASSLSTGASSDAAQNATNIPDASAQGLVVPGNCGADWYRRKRRRIPYDACLGPVPASGCATGMSDRPTDRLAPQLRRSPP